MRRHAPLLQDGVEVLIAVVHAREAERGEVPLHRALVRVGVRVRVRVRVRIRGSRRGRGRVRVSVEVLVAVVHAREA